MEPVDSEFPRRARENGGGFIVAGANYGQGSSREHAALVPLYLGIRGVFHLPLAVKTPRRLLHLKAVPRPDDAADAIAIALCHARSATSLLARAEKQAER